MLKAVLSTGQPVRLDISLTALWNIISFGSVEWIDAVTYGHVLDQESLIVNPAHIVSVREIQE